MNTRLKVLFVLASSLLACLVADVRAAQIDGTVIFLGGGSASQSSEVTTLSFNNLFTVMGGTGDYAFGFLAPATLSPISFTGTGSSAVLTSAVTPLWTFTSLGITYSFDLTSLTSGTVSTAGGGASLAISGVGIAHMTGKEDTAATWSLQGTGPGLSFTFDTSSTTALPSVPDGGTTVLLLGSALSGLALMRRRVV